MIIDFGHLMETLWDSSNSTSTCHVLELRRFVKWQSIGMHVAMYWLLSTKWLSLNLAVDACLEFVVDQPFLSVSAHEDLLTQCVCAA